MKKNAEFEILEFVETVNNNGFNNPSVNVVATETVNNNSILTDEQITASINEPLYDGVPIGKLLDKPIYANAEVIAYDGVTKYKKPYRNIKKGGYLGDLYSWVVADDGIVYLMFYVYDNTKYKNVSMFVPIKNGKTFLIPAIKEVKQEIKQEVKDKENAGKSTLEIYLDRYLPYIVGAIVFYFAFPSLQQVFKRKIAAIGNKEDNALFLSITIFLLVFMAKKGITEPQKIDTKFIDEFKAEINGYIISG